MELFDLQYDSNQYTNLASYPQYQHIVAEMQGKLRDKLKEVRTNDLGKVYKTNP